MKKIRWFIIIVVICLVANDLQAQNKISYIMDMVHHNPGEPLYESRYCRPDVLKDMGYNARCFFLFDSPTLAIDWDLFDKRILPEGSAEREWVEKKAARLHGMFNECKQQGLDVYAMSDLILLPKRLIELYGIESSFGNAQDALTQKILRFQIQQIFKQFPQMDGLVVRIGETYLEDAPFHKGNIQHKADADKCIIPLISLLKEEICIKLNKKLIFRTWWSFDVDAARYQYVSDSIEPHENLIISIKHCEGDFHRGNPFSKVLGMGRHQQLVEIQCAREYEGKGCYPNYIAKGVIDGFEEDRHLKEKGRYWCLRDIYKSEKLVGLWTWTRGGGWEGPYPKDELWCDLNAWILAQWGQKPHLSEEQLFNRYTNEILGLDSDNSKIFREIALLSEYATIRGKRSAQYPSDVFGIWVRDEYITFPELPQDKNKVSVMLSEKNDAVKTWYKIVALSDKLNMPDKFKNESVKVTCRYGLQIYRIYRSLFYLAAIRQGLVQADKAVYIDEYDDAWSKLKELSETKPEYCPSLYSKKIIRRTRTHVADDIVDSMR